MLRITRAQSKRASPTPEPPPPEEDVLLEPLPIISETHATPAVRTPNGKIGNQRKSTTKPTAAMTIDLSDEDNGGNSVSDEEDYSPSRSSPDSSPDRRSKDADGPTVLKKNRQTKINGFFPVLKKAERKETHVARKQGVKSGEDSADGEDAEIEAAEDEEEAEDKKEQDSATTRKKRKARRTSGGTRRSPAQKMATAAAAAAAVAARRPLQAKKSR